MDRKFLSQVDRTNKTKSSCHVLCPRCHAPPQVIKHINNRTWSPSEQISAHPVVSCFVLACRPMKMDVIEETVKLAQEEYRKLIESLKRCKSTKEKQNDRALQSAQDYDVEESLLPRFRQQVGDNFADTGECSYPS